MNFELALAAVNTLCANLFEARVRIISRHDLLLVVNGDVAALGQVLAHLADPMHCGYCLNPVTKAGRSFSLDFE